MLRRWQGDHVQLFDSTLSLIDRLAAPRHLDDGLSAQQPVLDRSIQTLLIAEPMTMSAVQWPTYVYEKYAPIRHIGKGGFAR